MPTFIPHCSKWTELVFKGSIKAVEVDADIEMNKATGLPHRKLSFSFYVYVEVRIVCLI